MAKGSEQGLQSPPASSSSVTINTAPFQAMQTVSMKHEWWLQFIIPVKSHCFSYIIIGYYVKSLPFVKFEFVELYLANGNTVVVEE